MDITLEMAEVIITQIDRNCLGCNFKLDPLSTRCTACGTHRRFIKTDYNSYYEHFEIGICVIHERGLHWCRHPKIDSELEDLQVVCVQCCKELLDGKYEDKKEGAPGNQPDVPQ